MIPVKVDQLFYSQKGFVVLLKGDNDERSVPIFIGQFEAQAIALHINAVEVPRPLTHDLLKNVVEQLGGRLVRIEVSDLADGTFFARLVVDRGGQEIQVDSRPSDAIALALRCSAPIFVAEKVMSEAGQVVEIPKGGEGQIEVKSQPRGKPLSPIEVLKRDLDKAVADERYEDAAKLRDEITRLESPHSGN